MNVGKETRKMSKFELTGEGGKGDKRRPAQVSKQEQDLRWELMFCKNKKRKEDIKRELKRLQREE